MMKMKMKVDAICVENLTKKYGDEEVLRGVDLRIEEGEFYALMGPNGSGKTTLASIIAAVRPPTKGKVEVYGKEPKEAKGLMGYVPQENFSSPLLTGGENLIYFAALMGYNRKEAKKLVDGLLSEMGLEKEGKKRVSKYSGGMRKKLEVATALFPCCRLLILDEPTTGLDPGARRDFLSLISKFREKNDIAVLLITHIGSDAELADRAALMDDGMIIAEGTPEELKKGMLKVINIDIETIQKGKKIPDILLEFSQGGVMESERGYRIFCEDPAVIMPKVVRALDSIGYKTERIEMLSPTLEDVFFKLTGKKIMEVG
jgi:ABC-type multidrug transport system ATPase subunit